MPAALLNFPQGASGKNFAHSLEGDADKDGSEPAAGVPPVPHDDTVIAASATTAMLTSDRSFLINPPS
ncbi:MULTISPECIES: hypothetical protein [Paenarthrobacter]|uniref:Uncharacterized protein n=1 Tax=Paenarthrobacter ureafaciens TaxID=37931 RepID=A0AAX3EFK9_PAEUR|nr:MULTISPECIES: hypothetical protein [Paenarthrobacter]MDO5865563.1 hypothetical protein [Paenarthrobacter sp. SD-2]MDO5876656.1 hypothetical protein [Paenarthrobacter sp. SD-1]QMU83322.1 hypothetical protein FV140_15425 [Paenarthrobacter ureafaciens]UYV91883.1 hypothetical protein NL395_15285 [Paenarthrobacter ureafaciens]UYV96418.1 hypothetical protein NL394_15310 [Paenarthrobacter ureafaciens]